MINATHYIIDLETMGKGSNAAIAAIGCVEIIGGTFSREIYRRVELSNSMSAGGITDADTIQWWLRQSAAARAEVDGTQPAELLFNVLGELRVFMTSMAHAHEILVWGNGATFDNVILSNAYAAYGMERPWAYWNDRDLRTLLALYPAAKALPFTGTKHHALDDARHEAKQLIAALQKHAACTRTHILPLSPMTVVRDECGHWTHPAWPQDGEENAIPKGWFAEKCHELSIVEMETDASEELTDAYFEQGSPDCSAWQPSEPPGKGWFIFSIHDTEDGPVCIWVRPHTDAAPAQETAA
ncbi:3'-5' exonuclease [Stutzerimonas nitrititolerans]|uniref:3'-5' exonuclease n=1 Tax=Stutzerimonas nitrititolerans TaxID=2482751 RepID=UPI0028AC4B3C|nr:3'-5' exonuclease [Stutzerimonas nitrititolerans]